MAWAVGAGFAQPDLGVRAAARVPGSAAGMRSGPGYAKER